MSVSITPTQAASRYSRQQIALHWAIALLFAFNYFVSDGMGRALRNFTQTGANDSLTAKLHIIGGITVLVLMVLRVILRLRSGAPTPVKSGPAFLEPAAKWGHRAIYLVLFLLPIAGLVAWFGGVKPAAEVHEVFVKVAVVLILGHIAAALYHQFVLKDNLMARMHPGKG